MAFEKIDEELILNGGVKSLPDSPQLQPAALKAKFDELGDAACVAFNNFIDAISAQSGFQNIGAVVPTGITASANAQSIMNVIAGIAVSCDANKHSHLNKTTLDAITSELWGQVTTLLELMSAVQTIGSNSMTPTLSTELPSSKAVAAYLTSQISTIKSAVYPVGAVVWTDGTAPATVYGFGTWTQIETVEEGLAAWKRTA
jgi:hypothetical protein